MVETLKPRVSRDWVAAIYPSYVEPSWQVTVGDATLAKFQHWSHAVWYARQCAAHAARKQAVLA